MANNITLSEDAWGADFRPGPNPAAQEADWKTTKLYNTLDWHQPQQAVTQTHGPTLYNEAMSAGADFRTDPNFPGENPFVPKISGGGSRFIPYPTPVAVAPRGDRFWKADLNPATEVRNVRQQEQWREYEHHYRYDLMTQYLTSDWGNRRDPYTKVVQQPSLLFPELLQQYGVLPSSVVL